MSALVFKKIKTALTAFSAAALVAAALCFTVFAAEGDGFSDYLMLRYERGSAAVGEAPLQQRCASGAVVYAAQKPQGLFKNGFRFLGWSTVKSGGEVILPQSPIVMRSDLTLYAVWEPCLYRVGFDYNGAESEIIEWERYVRQNDYYGRNADLTPNPLPVPARRGYIFAGWSRSCDKRQLVGDNSRFTVGEDIVLYASWRPKNGFIIRFDSDGGSEISDKRASWEDFVIDSEEPSREGFSFDGWLFEGEPVRPGTRFGELAESDESGTAITLSAKWLPLGGFTVSFDTNGGDEAADKTNVLWNEENLLPAKPPRKTGYAFCGWSLGAPDSMVSAGDSYGSLAKSETVTRVTLRAVWQAHEGNLVKYNGGKSAALPDKQDVSLNDIELLPAQEPEMPGYEFDGWRYNGSRVWDNTRYGELTSGTVLELLAGWREKEYIINYEPNNGYTLPSEVKGFEDHLLPDEPAQQRSGFAFEGWYADGVRIDENSHVSDFITAKEDSTLTVYAKWSEESHTVIYDTDGGGYIEPRSGVLRSESGLLPQQMPYKKGFEFQGWALGSGRRIQDDTPCYRALLQGEDHVVLTAAWIEKKDFEIIYNSVGGSAVSPLTNLSWSSKNLLPRSEPRREGYSFLGWSVGELMVDSDMKFCDLVQENGFDERLVLTARWSERNNYSVSYDTGCEISVRSREGLTPTAVSLLPDISIERDGYAFTGWYYNGKRVTGSDSILSLCGRYNIPEIELSAGWIPADGCVLHYYTDGGNALPDRTGVLPDDTVWIDEIPVRKGYSFERWDFEGRSIDENTRLSELDAQGAAKSLVLFARWRAKSYTVSMLTGDSSQDITRQSFYNEQVFSGYIPVRKGYSFEGWYCDLNQVTESDTIEDLLPNDERDSIVLTASWKENTVEVRYEGENAPETRQVLFTSESLLPNRAAFKSGAVLDGWCYGDILISGANVCADILSEKENKKQITLTPKWRGGRTVLYDVRGGYALPEKCVYYDNGSVLPDALPVKRSFVFDHWEYNGKRVTPSDSFSDLAPNNLADSITLSAVYRKAGDNTGSIEGVVLTDTAPARAVPGALVYAIRDAEVEAGPVLTNGDGSFLLCGLPLGSYSLKAQLPLGESFVESQKQVYVDGFVLGELLSMPDESRRVTVSAKNEQIEISGLQSLFEETYFSADPVNGITAEENAVVQAGGSIELCLKAERLGEDNSIIAKSMAGIKNIVGADKELAFYDISVIKTVFEDFHTQKTKLSDLPVLAEITISFKAGAGESVWVYLKEDTGYTLLDTRTANGQSFSFEAGQLKLRVRNGGIYAVVRGSIDGEYHSISVQCSGGGSMYPAGRLIAKKGESRGFSICADEGYEIADVEVDGKSVGIVEEYIFIDIADDHTITAQFAEKGKRDDISSLFSSSMPSVPPDDEDFHGEPPENALPDSFSEQKRVLGERLKNRYDDALKALSDDEFFSDSVRLQAASYLEDAYGKIAQSDSAAAAATAYNEARVYLERLSKQKLPVAASAAAVSEEESGEKPFVMLNFLMVLTALSVEMLPRLRRRRKKRKWIPAAAGFGAAVIFLVTFGFDTVIFADRWTAIFIVLAAAAIAAPYYGRNAEKEEADDNK